MLQILLLIHKVEIWHTCHVLSSDFSVKYLSWNFINDRRSKSIIIPISLISCRNIVSFCCTQRPFRGHLGVKIDENGKDQSFQTKEKSLETLIFQGFLRIAEIVSTLLRKVTQQSCVTPFVFGMHWFEPATFGLWGRYTACFSRVFWVLPVPDFMKNVDFPQFDGTGYD